MNEESVFNRRFIVTGGAGFIGSHLVDRLLDHHAKEVIIIDDLSRARLDWLEHKKDNRLKLITDDIVNFDFENIFNDGDIVYHLAAISRVLDANRDSERTFAVNTGSLVRIVNAAIKRNVSRLVFSSSREVYGEPKDLPVSESAVINPKNIYGASKAAAEMYLRVIDPADLEIKMIRFSNVIGPGDSGRVIPTFCNNVIEGKNLTIFGGEQVLDLLWVEDAVDILLSAGCSLEFNAEPINAGSGNGTSIREIAQAVMAYSNNGVEIEDLPSRDVEVVRFIADISRAKAQFGFEPVSDSLDYIKPIFEYIAKGKK